MSSADFFFPPPIGQASVSAHPQSMRNGGGMIHDDRYNLDDSFLDHVYNGLFRSCHILINKYLSLLRPSYSIFQAAGFS